MLGTQSFVGGRSSQTTSTRTLLFDSVGSNFLFHLRLMSLCGNAATWLAWDGPSAVCGGHGRSVFTAACLAVLRYFATASRCSTAFAHLCEGIPRRPSNRTLVAVPQLKHTSSSAISTTYLYLNQYVCIYIYIYTYKNSFDLKILELTREHLEKITWFPDMCW